MSDAYKKAGVDIDAGERLVKAIGPLAKSTIRAGADASLGGFGGLFDLAATGYSDPILVSGADGVGTKLNLAIDCNSHRTIGIDLVAMCANDILAQGAEPLFFLDYFATGKLEEHVAADVIAGIADGCQQAGCALIGGETAEMPGMYTRGHYDLAGFCVGAVERDQVMPRAAQAGDVMIALPSSGAHSNGYSLIRKIIADSEFTYSSPSPFSNSETLGEAFLAPTRLYISSVLPVMRMDGVRGFAHITGGGLTDNVPRILNETIIPAYDDAALKLPPLFQWLKDTGNLSDSEMRRTFNCGVGGVILCAKSSADDVMAHLSAEGENPFVIGHIEEAKS